LLDYSINIVDVFLQSIYLTLLWSTHLATSYFFCTYFSSRTLFWNSHKWRLYLCSYLYIILSICRVFWAL